MSNSNTTECPIGRLFGSWTVLGPGKNRSYWLCRCSCGTTAHRYKWAIINGRSESCGCQKYRLMSERRKTHGKSETREFKIWIGIINRCTNTRSKAYPRYGGRGIKVCQRWLDSFENFLADMGVAPIPNHEIDRFPDNNGDYCPENCRWATVKQQARNRRSNRMITHNRETKPLAEWAEVFKIPYKILWDRIKKGWTFEDAISVLPGQVPNYPRKCGKR